MNLLSYSQVVVMTGYGRSDGTIKWSEVSNGQDVFNNHYAELIECQEPSLSQEIALLWNK